MIHGSHRRLNALTGEWVLVSPRRTERPWQGEVDAPLPSRAPAYDPQCFLCPGNTRAGGARNPQYAGPFVFDNDFAALVPQESQPEFRPAPFITAASESGVCRVFCFLPRHDLSFATMDLRETRAVIDGLAREYATMAEHPALRWVQIFENRGAMMGASSPHPHAQIWASASLPNEAVKELREQSNYRAKTGRCLLCDYLAYELGSAERTVYRNDGFAAVVPFWAVWPFEVLLLPVEHVADVAALSDAQRDAYADAISELARLYDRLFETPFPYSMGLHQRPLDGTTHPEWHLHAHYYPPLLRSASVRKFMVGYELLAQPQRDITPEEAAARLRVC